MLGYCIIFSKVCLIFAYSFKCDTIFAKIRKIMQQDTKERISFIYDNVNLEPKEQIGLHQHPSWELSYVINGSGIRLIGDATAPFQSGDVVLVPPDIPHCWYFDDNITDSSKRITNITLGFRDTLLDGCAATFPETSQAMARLKAKRKSAVSFTGGKAEEIKRLLLNMRDLDNEARTVPLLRLILLVSAPEDESIINGSRKISREEERLNKAKIYIACNAGRNITLQSMASHMGMNRSSFCVFFKKGTGKTFVRYLNEQRVAHACCLLERHQYSVSEICYRAGFNEVPYFSRVFKQIMGVPPTEYRP